MLPVLAGPLILSLLAPPPALRPPAASLPSTGRGCAVLRAPSAPRRAGARPPPRWSMAGGGALCRDMAPQDLDEVSRLDQESYGGEGLWSRKMYEEELASRRSRVLVVSAQDRVVGVASISYVLDEGSIENIAVLPDARGQGLGSALLCGLLAHASSLGLDNVSLEVRAESNRAAIALYSSFGFEQAGRRKRYYSDGEDALILSRGPISPSELAAWEEAARARGHRMQL